MPRPHFDRLLPSVLALAATSLLLAGCGGTKPAPGNDVEMRDMEVVDGTVNDSMTDLDAVRTNGVGAVANGAAARTGGNDAEDLDNSAEAEAVPAE